MVEVIEKGNTPAGWSHDLICDGRGNANGGCGSKLRAFHTDPYYYQANSDWSSDAVVVVCPVCGTSNDLKEEDWPPKYKQLKSYKQFMRERDARLTPPPPPPPPPVPPTISVREGGGIIKPKKND